MNNETCEPRWSAIADGLIKHRHFCLSLATIIGILAYWSSSSFVLERRLESMFRSDDPVLRNYQQLQEQFGGNEVILIVYSDEDFRNPDREGLSNLVSLHGELEKIDGIRGVMDLSVVDRLIRQIEDPMGLFHYKNETGIFSRSSMAIAMLDLFIGTTHAAEGPWLAIACLLEPRDVTTQRRSKTIGAIRRTLQGSPRHRSAFLVGEPMMVEEGFEMIEQDGRRLGWISSAVLALLMLVVHRNVRWTVLTLLVVQWSLVVTRAICVLADWELTMVSSMLVAIVTVIGIATTMHWLFGYQQNMLAGLSPRSALQQSLRRLIRPIVWACITDALAFAALMAARVEPVRDYGLMMAVASLVSLLAILLVGPGLASIKLPIDGVSIPPKVAVRTMNIKNESKCRKMSRMLAASTTWREAMLRRSLHSVLRRRKTTLGFLAVWLILVVIGSSKLKVETDFLRNFKQDSSLVQGYTIVEQQMGGAGVWDVLIPAPVQLTREYLDGVSAMEDQLRQLDGGRISKVLSLADAEAASRRSPLLASLPIETRLTGMRAAMPSFFDSLITLPDGPSLRTLRIMLRSSERLDASEKLRLIESVKGCVRESMQSDTWKEALASGAADLLPEEPVVTGYYVLLSHLVQSVVADQWICFTIATLLILIALRLAIGSWILATVALVPNTLPALGAIAVLGLVGMKMNLGAAMIAAVSIGLSVDSSLHYLIDYQRERKSGLSCVVALEHSQSNVGVPVIYSTLALIIGFASLATSDFLPTVAFGTLSSITMVVGLIGNLWWLPVLVELVDRDGLA